MDVSVAKMNACRVATSTTSKRKKISASGNVTHPSTARPRITASPPPMNRMSMWPARMLAKSRTESEMIRTNWETASITKIGPLRTPGEPEHVRGVLRVGGQRQVADQVRDPDEEEERRHEREPARRHLARHVPARDL